jgi:hypothetical protein
MVSVAVVLAQLLQAFYSTPASFTHLTAVSFSMNITRAFTCLCVAVSAVAAWDIVNARTF